MRSTRDEMLMAMARAARSRGTCQRNQVGAIIAIESRPIISGYNGAPPGVEHCNETNCFPDKPCLRCVHAEANAILWAARKGLAVEGATLYTTVSPCQDCARMVHVAGIVRVVFDELYRKTEPLDYLSQNAIRWAQNGLSDFCL